MTRERAEAITNEFFKDMNPTFWNGTGNKPDIFREETWETKLTNDVRLEIVFSKDDEWNHYCDLVHATSGESFDMLSGYGIDSPLNLTDTIMDLCREYE